MREKIIVLRPGNLGDTLVARHAVMLIKDLYPKCKVVLHCEDEVGKLLVKLGCVEEYLSTSGHGSFYHLPVPIEVHESCVSVYQPCRKLFSFAGIDYSDASRRQTTNMRKLIPGAPILCTPSYSEMSDLPMSVAQRLFTDVAESEKSSARWDKYRDVRFDVPETPANDNYVVIHPGSGELNKAWDVDNYIEVARKIDDSGLKVFVTSGFRKEFTIACKLANSIPGATLIHDASLTQMSVLLGNAKFVLCNDSGIAHVASSVKVKRDDGSEHIPRLFVLFTKRNHRSMTMWAPEGKNITTISGQRAKEEIPVDTVLRALDLQTSFVGCN